MSTLNEFISSVKTEGMMTTNRFDVEIALPNILTQKSYNNNLKKVLLHCETVNLPGLNISTTQARTFGEIREMPYERLFDNVSMSFYIDNTMQVKDLFDTWTNESIQNSTSRTMNYYNDYISNIVITVYDRTERMRYAVTLYEAYPKNISPIQLDTAGRDVMKMQVSMQYKFWSHTVGETITGDNPMNPSPASSPTQTPGQPLSKVGVPNSYFTDFNAYQAGYNSFENARTSLFASSSQTVGFGSNLF